MFQIKAQDKTYEVNEEITDEHIRLIGENGESLGIVTPREALLLAEQKDLDVVKIAPSAVPPTCRLMNYGKFKYEQSKREKEIRRNQKTTETKELRLTPRISDNDLALKVKSAVKFLEYGDKVKISVRFRGREIARPEIGEEVLWRFCDACRAVGVLERTPTMEGRNITALLAPRRK